MMIAGILSYSGGADTSHGYEDTADAEEIYSCDQKMCHRFAHLIQISGGLQYLVNLSRWMFLKDAEVVLFENDKGKF